ncbi:unnamed protein product [Lymnaea stagnalis]|uniref:C-type lectin domain-containing protein n=1 Tax=Lymnaea stagnalis TaxID=6523 RepID=A0AAV2H9G0_LYMST
MKMQTDLKIVALLLVVYVASSLGGKCNRKDSYYVHGACFFLRQQKATYDNAKAECITEGGELALVKTEQHLNKIPELRQIFKHPYNVWIGARYNVKSGKWISEATGAPVFGLGQFVGSIGKPKEDSCGAVLMGYGDRWIDARACKSTFVFLCTERRVSPVSPTCISEMISASEATNSTNEENMVPDTPGADINTSKEISSEITEKDNGISSSPENGEKAEAHT